jgi:hypothetical protein
MAPRGFEPPTPGLKVQCSETRLSYGAILKDRRIYLKNLVFSNFN